MSDYWNISSVLAEETLLMTTFTHGATGIAKALDPGTAQADIKADAEVDIPLWLLSPLHQRGMAALKKLPDIYNERYRRKLNAGAECMNLKRLAPYFYEIGNRLNFDFLRDADLSAFLSLTFSTRYQELLSQALHSISGEQVLDLQSKLSMEEQEVFMAGRKSVEETERWMREGKRVSAGNASARRKRAAPADSAAGRR